MNVATVIVANLPLVAWRVKLFNAARMAAGSQSRIATPVQRCATGPCPSPPVNRGRRHRRLQVYVRWPPSGMTSYQSPQVHALHDVGGLIAHKDLETIGISGNCGQHS